MHDVLSRFCDAERMSLQDNSRMTDKSRTLLEHGQGSE
jgi:hypothetical protein